MCGARKTACRGPYNIFGILQSLKLISLFYIVASNSTGFDPIEVTKTNQVIFRNNFSKPTVCSNDTSDIFVPTFTCFDTNEPISATIVQQSPFKSFYMIDRLTVYSLSSVKINHSKSWENIELYVALYIRGILSHSAIIYLEDLPTNTTPECESIIFFHASENIGDILQGWDYFSDNTFILNFTLLNTTTSEIIGDNEFTKDVQFCSNSLYFDYEGINVDPQVTSLAPTMFPWNSTRNSLTVVGNNFNIKFPSYLCCFRVKNDGHCTQVNLRVSAPQVDCLVPNSVVNIANFSLDNSKIEFTIFPENVVPGFAPKKFNLSVYEPPSSDVTVHPNISDWNSTVEIYIIGSGFFESMDALCLFGWTTSQLHFVNSSTSKCTLPIFWGPWLPPIPPTPPSSPPSPRISSPSSAPESYPVSDGQVFATHFLYDNNQFQVQFSFSMNGQRYQDTNVNFTYNNIPDNLMPTPIPPIPPIPPTPTPTPPTPPEPQPHNEPGPENQPEPHPEEPPLSPPILPPFLQSLYDFFSSHWQVVAAICVFVVLILILLFLWCCVHNRKKKKNIIKNNTSVYEEIPEDEEAEEEEENNCYCYCCYNTDDDSSDNNNNNTVGDEENSGGDVKIDTSATIDYSELRLVKVIGRGSFADVYEGSFRGSKVAIKKIPEQAYSKEVLQDLFKEATLMLSLRHAQIVTIHGVVTSKHPCIVMEFMSRGTLFDLLRNKEIILENGHIVLMAIDICKGMAYLHENSVIHRDLKTKNILLDEKWNCKVADFGLSKCLEEYKIVHTLSACGTPAYAAPEVLRKEKYSFSADVYSFAMVLFEMLTKRHSFEGTPAARAVMEVASERRRPKFRNGEEQKMAKPLIELMEECWEESPLDRPSFQHCVETLTRAPIKKSVFPPKKRSYDSDDDDDITIDDSRKANVSPSENLYAQYGEEDEESIHLEHSSKSLNSQTDLLSDS